MNKVTHLAEVSEVHRLVAEFCREHPVDEKATDGVIEVRFQLQQDQFLYFEVRDLLGFPLVSITFGQGEGGVWSASTIVRNDDMYHRILVQQRIKALQLAQKLLDKVAAAIDVDF